MKPATEHLPARGGGRARLGGIALLVLLSVLAGCGTTQAPRTTMVPYTPEQLEARSRAEDARYRIRPGDTLRLAFKYEKELNEPRLLVLPDGYVIVPGVGSVQAAGRTIPELDVHLNEVFAREYRDPELTVAVVDLTEPEVYVMGAVEHPGKYTMPLGGAGVMQAIAMAGGFRAGAQTSQTVILRAGQDGFVMTAYDLSHIEKTGIMDLTYLDLKPYDIVYVPNSTIADFKYVTNTLFDSVLDITDFFWDIYALANIDKIDRLVR